MLEQREFFNILYVPRDDTFKSFQLLSQDFVFYLFLLEKILPSDQYTPAMIPRDQAYNVSFELLAHIAWKNLNFYKALEASQQVRRIPVNAFNTS